MGKYFAPLGVFVFGNILLLVASLLMPGLDTAVEALATETAAVDTFAGTWWTWLMSSGVVRLLLYFIIEACILVATAKAFLAVRNN